MGKSNRIRTQRAEDIVSRPLSRNKKKKAPAWLGSVVAAVVALIVLLTVVFGMLSSNGTIMRLRRAMYSDDYTINGNMMQYYYQTQYQSFYSTYSSYLSYFSLDTSKSLKDQKFGDTSAGYGYETMYLGAFDGTWFDYFMNLTQKQCEQILIYCEEADERGIKLDDDDYAEIEEALDSLESNASLYGYTKNSYISAMYGEGIKEKDIRKAMELSALASKCIESIEEELESKITEEQINAEYGDNKLDYDMTDYDRYTVKVSYEDVCEEVLGKDYTDDMLKERESEVLAKYKEKIDEAKAELSVFEESANIDDFEKALFEKLANEHFEDEYGDADIEDADKPSEEALAAIKAGMVDKLVAEMLDGAEETSDDVSEEDGAFTAYGQSVTEILAGVLEEIKESVFDSLLSDKSTYIYEKAAYEEDDEFSEWAFGDGIAANDIKTLYDGDGAEDGEELTSENGSFSATVYMIKKARYRDTTVSKNVLYMSFSSEDDAKAAIEALISDGKFTKEAFEAIAADKNAQANGLLENYLEGSMTSASFEEWLYDDSTVVGSYTETPVQMTETTSSGSTSTYYAVMLYLSDGEEAWHIDVKSTLLEESYEAYYKNMESTYTVTVKSGVLKKIDG